MTAVVSLREIAETATELARRLEDLHEGFPLESGEAAELAHLAAQIIADVALLDEVLEDLRVGLRLAAGAIAKVGSAAATRSAGEMLVQHSSETIGRVLG